jgi:drug/metabolite transporter (DMT)-like permease
LKKYSGPFFLTAAFALAGTSVIAARLVGGLGVFGIAAVSLLSAALFLVPLCGGQLRKSLRALTLQVLLSLFLQAFFGIFLFRVFLLYGLKLTSAGEAGILTGATPAITAVLAILALREPPSGIKLLGILSTVGGVLLLQGVLSGGLTLTHLLGNILVLCAAAAESVFNVLSRLSAVKGAAGGTDPLGPAVRTLLVVAAAFLLCLIPALLEGTAARLYALALKEWLALLWYGVFVTGVGFVCWYRGIGRGSALSAAAFSGMMPLTVMLLSVLVLGERGGWPQWTGAALVVLGMLLLGGVNAADDTITTEKGLVCKNAAAE